MTAAISRRPQKDTDDLHPVVINGEGHHDSLPTIGDSQTGPNIVTA